MLSRRAILKSALLLPGTTSVRGIQQSAPRSNNTYQPKFIIGSPLEQGIPGSALDISEQRLLRLEDRTWDLVLSRNLEYQPTTLEDLAKRLRSASDSICPAELSKPARSYLVSYMVAVWAKTRMKYLDAGTGISHTGTDTTGSTVAFEKRGRWINVSEFLRCTSLIGACRHSAVLVRELINRTGGDLDIDARYVGGFSRGLPGPGLSPTDTAQRIREGAGHGWNMVRLSNGLCLPFDATGTDISLNDWKMRHQRFTAPMPEWIIPRTPEQLEIFLGRRYGTAIDWFTALDDKTISVNQGAKAGATKDRGTFMTMSLSEWFAEDTRPLDDLVLYVRRSATRR